MFAATSHTVDNLSFRRLAILAALAFVAALAVFAQPAATQGPAKPYITTPGISTVYNHGAGIFSARINCGPWQAVVQFTAGTRGRQYVSRTIYICDTLEVERVRFTVHPSQLGPFGTYNYRIKVGRHDANGNVVRWTHSLSGQFELS